MVRTPNLPGRNTRKAVSLEIVRIDWGEQQVDGVDIETLTTEGERDDRIVGARDDETALAIALRPGDLIVEGRGVSGGSNNEGGTGIEDGGTV